MGDVQKVWGGGGELLRCIASHSPPLSGSSVAFPFPIALDSGPLAASNNAIAFSLFLGALILFFFLCSSLFRRRDAPFSLLSLCLSLSVSLSVSLSLEDAFLYTLLRNPFSHTLLRRASRGSGGGGEGRGGFPNKPRDRRTARSQNGVFRQKSS